MSISIAIHEEGHETYAEHEQKNAKDMSDLLDLLSRNLQLSISDLEWIKKHPKPTDEELADYIKGRTERDDD